MIVDNYNKIRKILHFTTMKDVFHLSVHKRKLYNPGMKNFSETLFSKYISHIDDYTASEDLITKLCNDHNAECRFYINRRNVQNVCMRTLAHQANLLKQNMIYDFDRSYHTSFILQHDEENPKWIISVDDKHRIFLPPMMKHLRKEHVMRNNGSRVFTFLKVHFGWQLITNPFDKERFFEKFPFMSNFEVIENESVVIYGKYPIKNKWTKQ